MKKQVFKNNTYS